MKRLESRVLAAALASLAPLLVIIAWLVASRSAGTRITVAIVAVLSFVVFVAVLRAQINYPLRTMANLISALREEDYSIRVRGAGRRDGMGELTRELNLLTDTLRDRRFGEVEAAALVRSVLEHIDSAIFTFDERWRLRLVNRAGERLLGRSAGQLHGRTASELGVEAFLTGDDTRSVEIVLPGGHGRFRIRRTTFRQSGVPHVLLSMSDLSRALREEERQAWQRLLRVLSHELNNSLTPIRSIAGSLGSILKREPLPEGWQDDAQQGLEVIDLRAAALTRFLQAYSEIARLPQPQLRPMDVGETVRRVAELETRVAVDLVAGPEVTIHADGDQIEQLLINLVRNGADAVLETGGRVTMSWSASADAVEISVADEGAGISGTANLFIPFFTTKPGGMGIGLTLARQIAEAHNGVLTLSNRNSGAGAVAKLRLPY
ncbi:MAG TPA: ATP-binding protein [Thermoanaerobaculia bacterium]|jgi:PAS domain S-box-containing protein|nr:ATP-binding protein [Thermoanaerobaculia bacterium]